jgi:hypothetical protein
MLDLAFLSIPKLETLTLCRLHIKENPQNIKGRDANFGTFCMGRKYSRPKIPAPDPRRAFPGTWLFVEQHSKTVLIISRSINAKTWNFCIQRTFHPNIHINFLHFALLDMEAISIALLCSEFHIPYMKCLNMFDWQTLQSTLSRYQV